MTDSTYVDRNGQPIDLMTWSRLYEADRTIGRDLVGTVVIHTVWTGVVEPLLGVQPFGTALQIPGSTPWAEVDQYGSEEQARVGHQRVVALARQTSWDDPYDALRAILRGLTAAGRDT